MSHGGLQHPFELIDVPMVIMKTRAFGEHMFSAITHHASRMIANEVKMSEASQATEQS